MYMQIYILIYMHEKELMVAGLKDIIAQRLL